MRLAFKLAAALIGLLIAVLAIEGVLRINHEREIQIQDIAREQRLLGRALQPLLEIAWDARGIDKMRALVGDAERSEKEVSIRIVSFEEVGQAREGAQVRLQVTNETVRSWVPLAAPDGELYLLELSESLDATRVRLGKSARRVLDTALIVLMAAAALTLVLGQRLVGLPVRGLVARASRIADGDLTLPSYSTRQDEVGELERALSSMVEGLAISRRRIKEESAARVRAERALRRRERLAAVGTLSAGVAHELGTPLQVVDGRAQLLESDGTLSDGARRNATIIRQQSQKMDKLVRQLLTFARPERSERKSLRIADMFGETIQLLTPLVEPRGVMLLLGEVADAEVHADASQLAQVFNNLIQNAADAMPQGGTVTLSADLVDRVAPSGTNTQNGRWVRIAITDTGCGISSEHLGRVFDPFFTTKDVGSGTGLGLSIAHSVVSDHGGWIELEGEADRGTTALVYLPVEIEP